MKRIVVISVILIFSSCSSDDGNSNYLRWVGDSKHDPKIDTTEFQLCNSEKAVKQYFHFDQGLKFKGEKIELVRLFSKDYTPIETSQCGWVRIRFVVNCNGKTGRFRLTSSDFEYQEQTFDTRITDQLLKITQSLEGWEILSIRDKPRDYYQYLIFKIDHGSLIEIMP